MGKSLAMGYLRQCGLKVQQEWVGKALVRPDAEKSQSRVAALIKRRNYCVSGPNSLLHADEQYNFLSSGFVVHGATDGYSRQIAYLHCSTNNKKETVLKRFEEANTD